MAALTGEAAVVDCEGCVAPCCRRFVPRIMGVRRAGEELLEIAQSAWDGNLRVIRWRAPVHGVPWFDASCAALGPDSRCTVYATRPGACQIYDCRADPFRWEDGEAARCEWPRRA